MASKISVATFDPQTILATGELGLSTTPALTSTVAITGNGLGPDLLVKVTGQYQGNNCEWKGYTSYSQQQCTSTLTLQNNPNAPHAGGKGDEGDSVDVSVTVGGSSDFIFNDVPVGPSPVVAPGTYSLQNGQNNPGSFLYLSWDGNNNVIMNNVESEWVFTVIRSSGNNYTIEQVAAGDPYLCWDSSNGTVSFVPGPIVGSGNKGTTWSCSANEDGSYVIQPYQNPSLYLWGDTFHDQPNNSDYSPKATEASTQGRTNWMIDSV